MKYTVLVYQEDNSKDGYWARVAELPGCFTSGKTIAEVEENAREAIDLYLADVKESGEPLPRLTHKLEVVVG